MYKRTFTYDSNGYSSCKCYLQTGNYDNSLNKLDHFGTGGLADSFHCKVAGNLDSLNVENKMAAYASSCCRLFESFGRNWTYNQVAACLIYCKLVQDWG